jgi:hypothetical protein
MTDEENTKLRAPKIPGPLIALGGAAGGLTVGLAIALGNNAYSDPLDNAMRTNTVANIQPDQLAADIAKNPILQARWKAMRELVQSIDQKVGQNLEQGAGASKETAQHWADRVKSENDTAERDGSSGAFSRHGGGGGLNSGGT